MRLRNWLVLLGILVATLAWAATLEDPPVFVSSWGTWGSGPGQFKYPQGIAVDAAGNIYVADYVNHRVQKFDSQGNFLLQMGPAVGTGTLTHPAGVAVSAAGRVYVTDEEGNGVVAFTTDGVYVTAWSGTGPAPGAFSFPKGIATDATGNVYVVDSGNSRIQKFTADGQFIAAWGSEGHAPGQLNGPEGIAIGPSGDIYVTNFGDRRVEKFSSDGTFVLEWSVGQMPWFIACDNHDNVYITDRIQDVVYKHSSSGQLLTQWGSPGGGNGQFASPTGIAVTSSGDILVADPDSDIPPGVLSRVQRFSSTPTAVRATTLGAVKARYR